MENNRDNRDRGGYQDRDSRDSRDRGGSKDRGGYQDRDGGRGDRDGRGGDRFDMMRNDTGEGLGSGKKSYRSKYRSEFPSDYVFDYKDPVTLYRFIMESGKIVPARISKLSLYQQKKLASAIKKARSLALLPVGTESYDYFERPEPLSPKPFQI